MYTLLLPQIGLFKGHVFEIHFKQLTTLKIPRIGRPELRPPVARTVRARRGSFE